MRTLMLVTTAATFLISTAGAAKGKKPSPDLPSLTILQEMGGCAQSVLRTQPDAPPHYLDKACGCLLDDQRNMLMRGQKAGTPRTKATKACVAFAQKHAHEQKPLPSPLNKKLAWGSEQIAASVVGCAAGTYEQEPPLTDAQKFTFCGCFMDTVRRKPKQTPIEKNFDAVTDAEADACIAVATTPTNAATEQAPAPKKSTKP